MVKLFSNLPDSLTRFNPEAPPLNWYSLETYDDNKMRHSFNDLPIMVESILNKRFLKAPQKLSPLLEVSQMYEFRWYSHGVVSRPDNKPPIIIVGANFYRTYNEKRRLHAYNGNPSEIELLKDGKFVVSWHENGQFHRDDDLPASIEYLASGDVEVESYMINGEGHRNNGLPAEVGQVIKTWLVEGTLHNPNGFAEEYFDTFQGSNTLTWSLYGVELTEAIFDEIKEFCNNTGAPLWVSFMLRLKMITSEHLSVFMDSNNKWESITPAVWVLRTWGVTDEKFSDKIEEALTNKDIEFAQYNDNDKTRFQVFVDVIKSDEKDALACAAQEERKS